MLIYIIIYIWLATYMYVYVALYPPTAHYSGQHSWGKAVLVDCLWKMF